MQYRFIVKTHCPIAHMFDALWEKHHLFVFPKHFTFHFSQFNCQRMRVHCYGIVFAVLANNGHILLWRQQVKLNIGVYRSMVQIGFV